MLVATGRAAAVIGKWLMPHLRYWLKQKLVRELICWRTECAD